MGDVFEDVVSDEEFSDVDNGAESLSDEDIAHVLGLMGDSGGNLTSSIIAPKHRDKHSSPPSPQPTPVKITVTEAAHSQDHGVNNLIVVAAAPPTAVSDFDRFLADFTQQQATRPIEATNQIVCSSSSLNTFACVVAQSSSPLPTTSREESRTATTTLWDSEDPSRARKGTQSGVEKNVDGAPSKWGVFTPDKMPARASPQSMASPSKKLKVVVPSVAYLRTKTTRTQRPSRPASDEWTFRPTINKSYFRRRGMARLRITSTARFTTRMQHDISEREERRRRRQADKQKRDEREVRELSQRRRSLVAKGSQAILERNGLWEESIDDRLARLLKRTDRHSTSKAPSASTKARKRQQLRDKEDAKARACESLYQRGVDKLQRARDEFRTTPVKSHGRRSSHRSDAIVRERLEREVELICSPQHRHSERSSASHAELSVSVSFVEFSCVLLYFGFVPAADTPWESDSDVTLLWHAWSIYAEREGDARSVSMPVLKQILESVIIKHYHFRRSIRHQGANEPKDRLLEIFRLNYIARKQQRGVSAKPDDGSKQHKSRGGARRISNVTYTLHGKLIQTKAHVAACDLLDVRHSLAQQRVEAMRREKEQGELAECTFKPQITSVSSATKESLATYRFRETDNTPSSSTEPEAFDRLYSDAFVRQNNNRTQYVRARQDEEEKCKKEMQVSPTYVNGLTIDERLERLHASLSNNALPVHFYEKITAMRDAHAAKIEEARAKASRLEPAHVFPKSRDGHTIVVPFQFATQQRMQENRRTKTLREMRVLYTPATEATHRSDAQADASDAADLCIDVHVSPFETYQFCLNRGDDVDDATRIFADVYNLDSNQRKQLLRHAQDKLEQLFNL